MFKTSVTLNKSLCQRAARCAAQSGYSSLEEMIEHLLEKELARSAASDTKADVEKKLKGLGYLD
ncbi:MAG: hypothetical protein IT162_16705 [Bryobacterales bacterium]|nr:hypothetical protein [Bryobacterales bacterium]